MFPMGHRKEAEYLGEKIPPPMDGNSKNKWRVTLREGERKTQKMQNLVGLTMAYLKPSLDEGGNGPVSVMFQRNNDAELKLCTLSSKKLWKSLCFVLFKGHEVTFSIKGKGIVRINGHVLLDTGHFHDCSDDELLTAAGESSQNETKHSEKGNDVSGSKKRKYRCPVNGGKKSRREVENKGDTDDDTDEDTDEDTEDTEDSGDHNSDEDTTEDIVDLVDIHSEAYERMTFSTEEDDEFYTSH